MQRNNRDLIQAARNNDVRSIISYVSSPASDSKNDFTDSALFHAIDLENRCAKNLLIPFVSLDAAKWKALKSNREDILEKLENLELNSIALAGLFYLAIVNYHEQTFLFQRLIHFKKNRESKTQKNFRVL